MDKTSLIDFTNDNCYKLSSPLIPIPDQRNTNYAPRLSDIANNPFDEICRKIANNDDPFECIHEHSLINNNKTYDDSEDKENTSYLISPFQTPIKSRKNKKILTNPLYINNDAFKKSPGEAADVSFNLLPKLVTDLKNNSQDLNITDSSLQLLHDSFLSNMDSDLEESFNKALNLPLPNSSDEQVVDQNECESRDQTVLVPNCQVPAVCIYDENNSKCSIQSYSDSAGLNNAFLGTSSMESGRSNKLSTKSSVTHSVTSTCSFNPESLGNSTISNIFPSTSSTLSKSTPNQNQLDRAFIQDSETTEGPEFPLFQRKCLSAQKPTRNEFALKSFTSVSDVLPTRNLNNSFAGFDYKERKTSGNYDDDSVFLNSMLKRNPDYDDDLSNCIPPWEEENICFSDNEEEKPAEASTKDSEKKADVACLPTEKNEKVLSDVDLGSNEKEDNEVTNAKSILHNLTQILKCDGNVVEQKKLGENLLNSLALALNIETPKTRVTNTEDENCRLKNSLGNGKKTEAIKSLPKIRTQTVSIPAATAKFEKNLKTKNDKDKVASKGPLKAVIPLQNMAKNKRSVAPKTVTGNVTPPKNSHIAAMFQIKKTSTPNESKLKPPIAQSTPDNYKKCPSKDTPVAKRQFMYSLSPLARPASTSDISSANLNKSLSPKDTSGSVPNVNNSNPNKSGSSFIKQCFNSSIPKIGGNTSLNRRKSAGDLKASAMLNRSYESNKKAPQPSKLKRSSSFQNKLTQSQNSNSNADNNNTYKKYGIPGKLKTLNLVPKSKKSTATE